MVGGELAGASAPPAAASPSSLAGLLGEPLRVGCGGDSGGVRVLEASGRASEALQEPGAEGQEGPRATGIGTADCTVLQVAGRLPWS